MLKQTTFLILFLIPIWTFSQNIQGPLEGCIDDCNEYTIENGDGGPYIWSASLATITTNQGETITICWSDVGTSEVNVIDLSGSTGSNQISINVNILPDLIGDIFFPEYPTCTSLDSIPIDPQTEFPPLICQTACEDSYVDYFVTSENPDHNYHWIIEGGQSSSNLNSGSISVHWTAAGFGSLILIETNSAGCESIIEYCIEILEKPDVNILVNPSNSVCVGQPVYLEAVSENATQFQWSLDGQVIGDNITTEVSLIAAEIILFNLYQIPIAFVLTQVLLL